MFLWTLSFFFNANNYMSCCWCLIFLLLYWSFEAYKRLVWCLRLLGCKVWCCSTRKPSTKVREQQQSCHKMTDHVFFNPFLEVPTRKLGSPQKSTWFFVKNIVESSACRKCCCQFQIQKGSKMSQSVENCKIETTFMVKVVVTAEDQSSFRDLFHNVSFCF